MRHIVLAFLIALCATLAGATETDRLGVASALGMSGSRSVTATNAGHVQSSGVAKPPASVAKIPTDPVAEAVVLPLQHFDYSANLKSSVFGAQLFSGTFAREGATRFNPDYLVAIGDRIQLRLWGAFDFDSTLVVDPQGSIFLPHIGPVKVLGVRNQELQPVVEAAVRRVYRANVYSYVSLTAAQPVRIFVGGFVRRPGLYDGTSMDSLLHYIDQAGGIDLDRGSFLSVQVKRGSEVRASVNLYDFLLDGRIPVVQLTDGDVIFIAPRKNTVQVTGLAANANRFEFDSATLAVTDLVKIAKPQAEATHVRIVRNTGTLKNVEYYSLEEAVQVSLANGDELSFTADKRPGTITVRVEGEHQSAQEYVLPYGSRMGDLIKQIRYTENSDLGSIQLVRQSVRERQRLMLHTALKSLESSVLTARSGTSDEAQLRKEEADLVLQWVDRARKIEPSGQVLIAQAAKRDALLLENGDVLRIPIHDGLVLVNGEVLFPNAIAFDARLGLDGYIRRAGGYAQNADTSRIVIAHRDGSFDEGEDGAAIRAGDEILVLPKIDVKSRQIFKDLTQILYQIAISAKVVLGL